MIVGYVSKMSVSRECVLRCVKSNNIIAKLESCKEFILGRGPVTSIIDVKLSKNQVSLTADLQAGSVTVQCLGGNASGVNNKKLKKGETSVLQHGDQLELLLGKYIYKVEFSPPPLSNLVLKEDKVTEETDEESETGSHGVPLKKAKLDEDVEQKSSKNGVHCLESLWEEIDRGKLYIFTKEGTKSSEKIAGYDLDGTIILTKSGRVFPQNRDDWKLANASVQPTLKKLIEDGFKVVIFTNQAGISRGKTSIVDFKYKIEKIIETLDIPVQVFVATSDDIYRKPAFGMWDVLTEKKNSGVKININESFFVGDAAGREQNWMPKKKKDFSCADRLFALNVGLKFHTPEAHFLKQPEGKYKLPEFNPMKIDINAPISSSKIISESKEIVIMVGSQGSGKTFFVTNYLVPKGYSHINRDNLGAWQKCVINMENDLRSGKSVAIDNTNPDKASRKRYLDVAKQMSVPCRCFLMASTIEHAKHNNKFRELTHVKHVEVTEIMINSYRKKFEMPTKEEGFTEIVTINFVPKFDDSKKEKLYKMFLL